MHIPGKNPVKQVAKESSGLVDNTSKESRAESLLNMRHDCPLVIINLIE